MMRSVEFGALFVVLLLMFSSSVLATSATTPLSLELDEGSWISLDVSPDGEHIVFELLNDIYLLPAKGGKASLIHGGAQAQHSPRFSPDGQTLAFISDSSGADNIWVSDLAGNNTRQITQETTAKVAAPAWSADGKYIAAVVSAPHILGAKNPGIKKFSVAAGSGEFLVEPPASGKDVQEPVFSRDGKYLYYTERVAGDHYVYVNTGLKNFEVKRLTLANAHTQSFITGFGGASTAQISSNGKTIAFVRRAGAKTVLYAMDVDSRQQRSVYDGLDRDLQGDYLAQEKYYPAFAWFPDNRHVAIWAQGKLHKIDMQTGQAEPIPFFAQSHHEIQPVLRVKQNLDPDTVEVRAISQLAINPKNRQMVFRALGQLWVMPISQDAKPVRLTSHDAAESDPSWSRDGKQLVYVAWRDGDGARLMLRDTVANTERELVHSKAMLREPVFSPDGATIAYRVQEADTSFHVEGYDVGLFIVSSEGGTPRFVTPADKALQFSTDGQRIFFLAKPDYYAFKAVDMRSVKLDGSDVRYHAVAPTADTGDFSLSPDNKWLAFKAYNLPFVIPFSAVSDMQTVSYESQSSARNLSVIGGYSFAWSPDSSGLFFTLGPQVFMSTPDTFSAPAAPVLSVVLNPPVDRPEGLIALSGADIITISDGVIRDGVVLVEGNRIKAVGKRRKVKIPRDTKVINLKGKYLMPGFFDTHGHIDCCFGLGVTPQQQPTRYAALAYGVTTNFDPYSSDLSSYESGEMTLSGDLVGPRWLSSGQVVYGLAGKPDSTFHPLRSLDEARAMMLRRKALGPSILKSYKQPSRAQRQWIMQAAREAGYMVDAEGAGQFYNNITMVLDGHTNLEHNIPVSTYYDDLIELFAAADTSITPTLIVTFGDIYGENYIYQTQEAWKDEKAKRFIVDVNNAYNPIEGPSGTPLASRGMHSVHIADEIYDKGFRSVGRSVTELDKRGVIVNVGSHGQAAGLAIHWEMQLLAEGGMTPDRILRAATINGATAFGLDHQLGTVEAGKLADLIVLDKNPLKDIKNTNSVIYTMVNGRLYDANTMDEVGLYPKKRMPFYFEQANSAVD